MLCGQWDERFQAPGGDLRVLRVPVDLLAAHRLFGFAYSCSIDFPWEHLRLRVLLVEKLLVEMKPVVMKESRSLE
jgi:hypothetical protein